MHAGLRLLSLPAHEPGGEGNMFVRSESLRQGMGRALIWAFYERLGFRGNSGPPDPTPAGRLALERPGCRPYA